MGSRVYEKEAERSLRIERAQQVVGHVQSEGKTKRAERSVYMEWVVRAGEAKPDKLLDGYTRHEAVPTVYDFSVQYAAGRNLDELALAGQFLNAQISYAYDDELATALLPLGYTMKLVPTPGKGLSPYVHGAV